MPTIRFTANANYLDAESATALVYAAGAYRTEYPNAVGVVTSNGVKYLSSPSYYEYGILHRSEDYYDNLTDNDGLYINFSDVTQDTFLAGGNRDDIISAGAANDILAGGGGADLLSGGGGSDTASYISSVEGVRVSLLKPDTNTGDAAGDVFIAIENIAGSDHNDTLIGNRGANSLTGGSGNDVLSGGAGRDVLTGGLGADRLFGGRGADTFVMDSSYVGNGLDRVLDFSSAEGDKLDVSVYRNFGTEFTFIGDAAFTPQPGEVELRVGHGKNDSLLVEINFGYSSTADVTFVVKAPSLSVDDFIM